MAESVVINEVGLRDGLQNQPRHVPTAEKLHLLDALLAAGVTHAEVGSFVSPKAVPQMADSGEVYAALPHRDRIDYSVLVPNVKGYERAVAAGAKVIAVTPACTEGMNRANLNMGLEQAVQVAEDVMRRVRADGLTGRAYLATAFVCPFDGPTDPDVVVTLAQRMFTAGAHEVAIADTIGAADPIHVARLFDRLAKVHDMAAYAGHFHDTKGMALANAFAAYERGVRRFDASIGGLGGCPFAPGAAGNAATEDLVNMFEAAGIATGIDLMKLADAVAVAESCTQRTLGGRWMNWKRGQDARQAAKAQVCAA